MWSFGKRWKRRKRDAASNLRRRTARPECLEPRCMMAADPLHVGLVYLETDYVAGQDQGADTLADRFLLSFTGGADATELTEIQINTDKDGDGLTIGDLIFDTELGGRGKAGAHPFKVVRINAADPRATVTGIVDDGGQLLTLQLTHFRAGDTVEFSIDLDEVLRVPPNIDEFNSKLDVIASGQEFEDSILTAKFVAPHYEPVVVQDVFINDYGDPRAEYGLRLPPDVSDDPDSLPNRSAAAIGSTVQTPKPISIAGNIFVDDNLNLKRDSGESALAGVRVALWKKDASGTYVDTGLSAVTDSNGRYSFGTELGLMPGTYRVVEAQPSGYFSVGAVRGTVDGAAVGAVTSVDVLSEIALPLGDLHAVNYDFAEARPTSISGYVYRDDSDDGVRDPNEPGLANVRVRLVPVDTIAPQGELIVTTGADGSYRFDNLAPGRYRIVEVDQPAPYTDGLDTAGTVNGVRVGTAANPGDSIDGIMLYGGQSGVEYNFGELPLGSISGYVYLPPPGEDCEGPHLPGEDMPLADVLLRLYDDQGNLIAETRTAADGSYRFDNLPKGTYRIEEITPEGLLDGAAHVGLIDAVAVGAIAADGSIINVRLPAGKDGKHYDFCEAAPATVSGYVYHDASNDGRRGAGEQGIAGALVRLLDADGNVVATTTTDATGRYEFTDLVPGDYRIEEVTPQGYLDGLDRAGTVAGERVGAAENPGDRITGIRLLQGQAGVEYNFGELVPAEIRGMVHADEDGDCTLDPGEEPLAGVVIRLLDDKGREIARTTTDAQGQYRFGGLRPGSYTVVQDQPDGYFNGGQKPGSTGGDGSVENQIRNIVIGSAVVSVDNDFCERPPSELSGVVYADRDADCVRDPGEPGLAGVRIDLLDAEGRVVETTTTDAQGRYQFTNLRAGRYTVRETQPVGYLQGGQKAGSGGGDDSQRDIISQINIGWGETLVDYNFCELEPSSIEGRVFVDSDQDCVFEPGIGERALEGVTIRLHDATGAVIATTITNADGTYRFENLRPGEYHVSEIQPAGLFHGGQVVGSGGGVVAADDLITEIHIRPNQALVGYDFCELEPSSIQGKVFVDSDMDLVYEPANGERTLAGVTIRLHDESGKVIATTVTDAQGRYRFENLRPGEYRVSEVQPEGLFQGGQTIGSGGGVIAGVDLFSQIQIGPGQHLTDYDFSELEPSSISGTVYADSDQDCQYEPELGERPLAGVTVHLHDADGNIIATTQTNAQGRYRFENLRPGEYRVSEVQPEGYFQGGQKVGSGGGVVAGDDLITEIHIGPGQTLVDYNFCEIEPSSLSGVVFVDSDDDVIYEPDQGEEPLAGVTVDLYDEAGNRVARTVTDANGAYRFGNLRPGKYTVREHQPEGYYQGGARVGSGGGVLSGPDEIKEITIGPGKDLVNYDFCEVRGGSISGRVWTDTNLNNRFDTGEAPLEGVLVELFDADGKLVAQTRTDAGGNYQFTDLERGSYLVRETQPQGLLHGGQVAGSGGGNASVADVISEILLPPGRDLVQYDFPEDPTAIISGYVYMDGDTIRTSMAPRPETLRDYQDGKRSADDTPLAGVVLELRDITGAPFRTSGTLPGTYSGDVVRVVTDANGYYEFTGLRGGSYHIYQVQPDGFIDGLDTPGTGGGMAANAADLSGNPELQFVISTLSASAETDPKMDAILSVAVNPGGHARENNFSEILVETVPQAPPPPVDPPLDPPPPEDPIGHFPQAPPVFIGFNREYIAPHIVRSPDQNPTWHLSIINGGSPRGDGLVADAAFKAVANASTGRWSVAEANSGTWRTFDAYGMPTETGRELAMGVADGIPVVGDFNGDGMDEVAIFVHGEWLIDLNGNGVWDDGDLWVHLGSGLDRPVVGDWDGDGKDDVGIFGPEWVRDAEAIPLDPGLPDPDNMMRRGHKNTPPTEPEATDGRRLLQRTAQGTMRADVIDHVFRYGNTADVPLVGDWNGDGIDAIAVFRAGEWRLDLDGDGRWTDRDGVFQFGRDGDIPVVGDWNGDGIDELAVVRGNFWIIDSDGDRRLTAADTVLEIPRSEDEVPVAGDWDGDGRAEPGLHRTRRDGGAPEAPAA